VEQQMSDNDTPIKNESSNPSEHKKTEDNIAKKVTIQKAVANKKAEQATNNHPKAVLSKLALLALFVATTAIAASAAHYIWQQKQSLILAQAINEQRKAEIATSQTNIQKSLSAKFSEQLEQQQQTFNQQLKQVALQAHQESEGGVSQLSAQVKQLEQSITQRQPSDWLIHEAEYLIRIAARTMWLEHDTKAAIGLLKEADIRLSELKQPKFLPIRALINQDIATLALMPELENQQAILSLMALNKQVINLPLAGVNLNKAVESSAQDNFELSNDISDWQTNLKKTWQQFLQDFITVRHRTGMVEPLMTPKQQQNLKQNLTLKIQLAQWAASEQKAEIYQQTLVEIQAWMNEFFDMKADINQKFYQSLEKVKQHTIYFDYPNDLTSLTAINRLNNKTTIVTKPAALPLPDKEANLPEQSIEAMNKSENGEKR